MKQLTTIANKCDIRHYEKGIEKIDNLNLIDFLFYSYFNILYLILKNNPAAKMQEEIKIVEDEK